MNRALFTLMKLQARAALRRTVRGVRSVRGAAFFAVGVLVFGLWLGPALMAMLSARGREPVDPAAVRQYVPAALLLACAAALMGPGDKALTFSAPEVNFLFPGPFTRRRLLGYKLAKAAFGTVFMALFMSVALGRFIRSWSAGFIGAFLSLLLVQLFTTCVVIIGQTVNATAYTRGRRAALAVFIGVAMVGLGPALAAGSDVDAATLLKQFAASTPGRILLAPFQPFAYTLTAASGPELLGWGTVAVAVNLALLALILWLDANYLEAAAAASERVYERTQRMRRGAVGGAFGGGGAEGGGVERGLKKPSRMAWLGRVRVPRAPWFGGAGPVAWRQLTTAVRRSGSVLFVLGLSFAIFATFFVASRKGTNVRNAIFPAVIWFTILLVSNLKFDFRADLDQMPWLKSLPLRPSAVAAGQMATPVLLLTASHVLIFGSAAVVIPSMRTPFLAAAALALPFNVVLLGVENWLFLLFPSRGPAVPGEIGALGRQVVLMIVKLLVVTIACGLAGGVGGAAWAITRSGVVALAAAFTALAVEAVVVVPLVARAYARFDPGTDTPP